MTNSVHPMLTWFLPLVALLICMAGCRSHATTPPPGLKTVPMQIGQKTFVLEVADTAKTRERGLMFRDLMPADRGMIFVFGREEPLSFWMMNTSIPLDILFLSAEGRVVSIHQMKPFDLNGTPSAAPAMYAIELNQGAASAAGVKVGDQLAIPPEAQKAAEP